MVFSGDEAAIGSQVAPNGAVSPFPGGCFFECSRADPRGRLMTCALGPPKPPAPHQPFLLARCSVLRPLAPPALSGSRPRPAPPSPRPRSFTRRIQHRAVQPVNRIGSHGQLCGLGFYTQSGTDLASAVGGAH